MDVRFGRLHLYAVASRDSLGRVGARFYGLVAYKLPLLAWFVDDAWYEGDVSYGIAAGPLELGAFVRPRLPANGSP